MRRTARARVLAGAVGISVALLCATAARASWREVAALPEPRWHHAAGVGGDGRIYAFGGYVDVPEGPRTVGTGTYSMVVYDAGADRWSRAPEVPRFRLPYHGIDLSGPGGARDATRESVAWRPVRHYGLNGAAGSDGRIYWFGSVGPVIYDPLSRTWDQPEPPRYFQASKRWEGSVPSRARWNAATAVAPDGRIYLLGGVAEPLEAFDRDCGSDVDQTKANSPT